MQIDEKCGKYEKAVFVDLDGTLLDNEHKISEQSLDVFARLAEKNILRVVATGRSMLAVNKVLAKDFPIDYCIFSTGGGILDWQQNEIIKQYDLDKKAVRNISEFLIDLDLDFMLHLSIPDNHKYYFNKSTKTILNKDFEARCELYDGYINPFDLNNLPDTAAQFLVVSENEKDFELHKKISDELLDYTVILTTSPIDKVSSWIEIFPKAVSKGQAGKFLIKELGIKKENTMAIGNDFNDEALLEWAETSFVVENAPQELKAKYITVPSNEDDGFWHSVEAWLNLS